MFDRSNYFNRLVIKYQGSEEEKQCAAVLYNDNDVQMGDKRLNSIAALTWNSNSCQKIFAMLEKAIVPTENPWKVIYKALLIVHTNLLFGSELAVDKCIDLCKYIYPLQDYNSALVKKGFFNQGGVDYGGPVRAASRTVVSILGKDENIRKARQEARGGSAMLVPLGEDFEQTKPSQGINMGFGQAVSTSVGAGFGLENVPGMYEGRPERYFDRDNDPRRTTVVTGDSQYTRDKQAPSLLDLVFDAPVTSTNPNLPQADYLPALEKQKELERQLAEQQELLRKLQQQQLLQQPPPQQQYPPITTTTNTKPNYTNDLLGLSMSSTPYPPNPSMNPPMSYPGYMNPPPNTYHNSMNTSYPGPSYPLPPAAALPPQPSHDLLGMNDTTTVSNNNLLAMNPPPAPMLGMMRQPQQPPPQQLSQSSMNSSMMGGNGPTLGNESMFLEHFHQQYQSRSIRYAESPVNPNSNNNSNNNNNNFLVQPIDNAPTSSYDATTQLWSFDQSQVTLNPGYPAQPQQPPPPAALQTGYYHNNYSNNNNNHNSMMMSSSSSYPPQLPSGPPPDIPSGPPPPIPNFRP